MKTTVYLIRHAEAEGNCKRIFQGMHDADLSENGHRQLERLAERCRNYPFDAVYASPLRRAHKTAIAANRYHNLPIVLDEGLREINGGHWEGVLWESLPELYPEENRMWEDQPWRFAPEGGETMREVYDRIWAAVTALVEKHRGQNLCVVSHGCAIRNFLCRALDKEIERLNEVSWCDNTAVSIIEFDENLRSHVVLLNDASHLDEETSTFSKQTWWKQPETKGE